MTKARKTYVVSFYDEKGHYSQEYFQNKKQAHKRMHELKSCNLSHWIDGAEMIRLARLGYVYDSSTDSCKPSKHASEFIKEVDSLPKSVRDSKFLDYRKFRTMDDVIKYHRAMRKGANAQ